MDAQRWVTDQRILREAVRAKRRTPDGRKPIAAAHPAPAGDSDAREITASERRVGAAAPLASVIVVCWNVADVLARCLDQLFAQDYPNKEIIVVDDGSDDETLEIAEAASTRGELTLLRSPRNRGCPQARNLGLRRAKGEIVAFIDADGFADQSWLGRIVEAFAADETIGGAASTVFFDKNPEVINGAGGIVNRQGWAADLSMNESYEQAEIVSEALYPMGCGMALRRSAVERVGHFDDRMLNYYDDVDYGTRLWRAGYRVVVAPDAWIDHGFGQAGGDLAQKQLLCERHRMRVVLKHSSAASLTRWARMEARAVRRAPGARRAIKLRAFAWNARHLPTILVSRWYLRRAPLVPDRLVDPSWGDAFPAALPALLTPRPELAGNSIDMANPASDGQLIHGWFPAEQVDGRSARWAGVRAAAVLRLEEPSKRLRLEYTHVPVDIGEVRVDVRRLGSADPLAPEWSTRLHWQYISRSVENHPLALSAGDYEVAFSAPQGWSEPPKRARLLSFALARMSLEASFDAPSGGALDMASPDVAEQLVSGWFEPEHSDGRSYRWAGGHAAAVVRIAENATCARLVYRTPPIASEVMVSVTVLGQETPVWSASIPWRDLEWHEESFPLQLAAGDYLVSFDADAPWSNAGQRDPTLWAENRSLGFALSSMSLLALR